MPGCCVVPFCANKSAGGHLFPKSPELRKKWTIAIRRFENWEPSSYSTVCRAHFKENDYVKNGNPLRRQLKQHAVPSIFRWTMFQNNEQYKKQAKERSEEAGSRTVAKDSPDMFADYTQQEYAATEAVEVCSAPLLTTSGQSASGHQVASDQMASGANQPVEAVQPLDVSQPPVTILPVTVSQPWTLTRPSTITQSTTSTQTLLSTQASVSSQPATLCQPPYPDHDYCVPRASAQERLENARRRIAVLEELIARERAARMGLERVAKKRNPRGRPRTRPPKVATPQQSDTSWTRKEALQWKTAKKKKTSVVRVEWMDPDIKKVTYVPVDLPSQQSSGQSYRQPVEQSSGQSYRQPVVESSGQSCRQPVVESSGPTSSESIGPPPHLPAPAPFPVLLIGPQGKQFLSQQFPMQTKSREEEVCQSSGQPRLSAGTGDLVEPPVVAEEELTEERGDGQSCEEPTVTQSALESAAGAVEVKMEAAEEDSSSQCFQELPATPECTVVPVEVKIEAGDSAGLCHDDDKRKSGMGVELKMEPVEEDSNSQCFQEGEVLETVQEFAWPVEMKMKPEDDSNFLTPNEFAILPDEVKMEPAEEEDSTLCFQERDVHHTPQEFAVPAEVKMEPIEEDSNSQCYQEREGHETIQEVVVYPVEMKMDSLEKDGNSGYFQERELHQMLDDFAVLPLEVKTEPADANSDTLQGREVHQTPQDFSMPVEVKTEPDW